MSKYLQTNGKLKESTIFTYAWSLPAVETCPNAGACATDGFCFALLDQKRYPSALEYRRRSLELSKDASLFTSTINSELIELRTKHKRKKESFAVRIHASGDFYSVQYAQLWMNIAEMNPDIQFYAYTKSVAIFKRMRRKLPNNLVIIFSMGGQLDKLVDTNTDRHAQIFNTEDDAITAGYNVAASEDDTEAWRNPNHRVGLVIFGARKNNFIRKAS